MDNRKNLGKILAFDEEKWLHVFAKQQSYYGS
jgi:hypothetical protein